jgi:hypothetical protein
VSYPLDQNLEFGDADDIPIREFVIVSVDLHAVQEGPVGASQIAQDIAFSFFQLHLGCRW